MFNIGCKSHNAKYKKEMLYGKWVPVKDTTDPVPDTDIFDKTFFRQVVNGEKKQDRAETFWRYSLKGDTLIFHLTTVWDLEEKILCLNADSLIYQSPDDCRIFKYSRAR
jgi:hypothetical protein